MKLKKHASAAILSFLLAVSAVILWPSRPAQAVCTRCCNCTTVRNYIATELDRHEAWMTNTFWTNYLQPALGTMGNQIIAALAAQTASIGSFVEAQNNVEAMRAVQEAGAETASNYFSSEQLCRFGSLSQSLAESEALARAAKVSLLERSQARQLGTVNMAGATGSDVRARMQQFLGRYCDPSGNNAQMSSVCQTGSEDRFLNADIDYTRTLASKPTLNVDFSSGATASSDDEQNILALADNLFANDLFSRPNKGELEGVDTSDARVAYMDMRALIAKRSVAENSFNTIVGQKSAGATGSKEFIENLLEELGIQDGEITSYLGEKPSYDAQMEVLTKRIYQSPSFYINLMESPSNVQRQYAALQSFGLMQQRDIFDSILRSEMLLSLIVEMEVGKYQDEAQSLMDRR
jgi:hypothetical protein